MFVSCISAVATYLLTLWTPANMFPCTQHEYQCLSECASGLRNNAITCCRSSQSFVSQTEPLGRGGTLRCLNSTHCLVCKTTAGPSAERLSLSDRNIMCLFLHTTKRSEKISFCSFRKKRIKNKHLSNIFVTLEKADFQNFTSSWYTKPADLQSGCQEQDIRRFLFSSRCPGWKSSSVRTSGFKQLCYSPTLWVGGSVADKVLSSSVWITKLLWREA